MLMSPRGATNRLIGQKARHEVAKKNAATSQRSLAELVKERKYHRPKEKEIMKILDRFKVHRQQHYTLTLIGEHCHRFLDNNAEICELVQACMLQDITDLGLQVTIVDFMSHLRVPMEFFDFICIYLTRNEISTDYVLSKPPQASVFPKQLRDMTFQVVKFGWHILSF
jgi:hypothetical protein